MDAAQALADLTEISSQVVEAAIVDRDGTTMATTISDERRAERFVAAVLGLLDEAEEVGRSRGLPGLSQLEAATLDGNVFVVRRDGRLIAATTPLDPTVGLVFYDLKHALAGLDGAAPARGRQRRPRKKADASA